MIPVLTTNVSLPIAPPPPPRLHWVGSSSSSSCLWPQRRAYPAMGQPAIALEAFVDALLDAESRILIMDPHFDGLCGFAGLQDFLEDGARRKIDVRILTGVPAELSAWVHKNGLPQVLAGISIRELQRGIHDRFALVDKDLWHFGSTVGGCHPDLSAVTQGWFEHADAMTLLFENMWQRSNK